MGEHTIEQLVAELELKERTLKLVMAIDHIRDHILEPLGMLTEIVNLLANEFVTDLCLLALYEEETAEMELKAIHRRNGAVDQMAELISRDLAERAMRLNHIAVWETEDLLEEFAHLPTELQVAAVPIALTPEKHLGALLLARHRRPYTTADIDLLSVVEDVVDSAVIQGYSHDELQHRYQELELIYQIDRIRDQHLPLDNMLNAILQVVHETIPSESGFAMLYDQSGKRLGMRAATNDDLFSTTPATKRIDELAHETLAKGELTVINGSNDDVLRSFMCLPLILNEKVIGTLGVLNRYGPRGFTRRDRELLGAIGSQMDTAIFESLEKRHLRAVLGRSVDPRVMERILSSGQDVTKTERMELSVLYADMRGSTALAERTEPEMLVGYINDYLSSMTDVVLNYEGTLDKFVGDEVMALFGAPFPLSDHALRAVRVGLAMQQAHELTMAKWRGLGVEAAPIGVGISTGELIVGEMGSRQRTDYTVIGRAANLGARICSAATAGQVLICSETYRLVKELIDARPIDGVQFKGYAQGITVYEVLGLK